MNELFLSLPNGFSSLGSNALTDRVGSSLGMLSGWALKGDWASEVVDISGFFMGVWLLIKSFKSDSNPLILFSSSWFLLELFWLLSELILAASSYCFYLKFGIWVFWGAILNSGLSDFTLEGSSDCSRYSGLCQALLRGVGDWNLFLSSSWLVFSQAG